MTKNEKLLNDLLNLETAENEFEDRMRVITFPDAYNDGYVMTDEEAAKWMSA